MKKLKLSKLSKNNLNKRQLKQIKGGEQSAMWPCFCWGECRDYEGSRHFWHMGPRMNSAQH